MLKKCISLAIVCVMLAGLFVPAYADTSYTQYVTDFENASLGNLSAYATGATFNGVTTQDSLYGKTGNAVYKISTNSKSSAAFFPWIRNLNTRYTSGEKLHFSTEFMVPTGNTYASNFGPNLGCVFYTSPDASNTATCHLGVKNDGSRETNAGNASSIISFNPTRGRVELFGKSVYTSTTWKHGEWYKVDVVIVTGADPKAAVYVDGQPLRIDVDYGNGTGYHKDDGDATFDGVKTSSDYVDVGCRDSQLTYSDTGIYGIKDMEFGIFAGQSSSSSPCSIYFDNTFLKVLSATEQPQIDSDLAFKQIGDGASLLQTELTSLEVNVPYWYADATAKVAVSVDGAEPVYSTSAPFSFNLSHLPLGIHNIKISAFDAADNLLGEMYRQMSVVNLEADVRTVFEEDFNEDNPFNTNGELYYGTSPHDAGTDVRKITFENVTDSDDTTHKAALLYADAGASELKLTYKPYTNGVEDATKVIKTGVVNVSYDLCLKNDAFSQLWFCRRESYPFVMWDSTQKKFVTYNKWTGVSGNYSFDAEIDKWQKWEWTLDFENGNTATLKIDGETVLDKVVIQTSGETAADKDSFLHFGFYFNSTVPSSIAVDNFNVTCTTNDPYISSVDFGSGNSKGSSVVASATSATLSLVGRAINPADVENALQVIDVEAGSALSGVAATSTYANGVNTVEISGLSLEANKMYKIQIAEGMKFHTAGFVTDEAIEYTFNAVASLPENTAADDGVAGDITVVDVRYTLNGRSVIGEDVAKEYTGGIIEATKKLRADVMVNNASSEAQTFRVVIATYEDGELTGISLGEECTVLSKAESMVFTSGKIDISSESAPDIKVMILTDTNSIIPVSKAFSLDN